MSDDLSGRVIGRYQVLERLGRGGMAEVYRAYQPSLDRYVAIKVIYPHLAGDPDLLERFGREARSVAALRHPNIVQVHDFDVQAGVAFMAMEFIDGPTLKAAVQALSRSGRLLPLPVVGKIVGQLADALGYAHEQQIVHRDVKPANVLLRRRRGEGAPAGQVDPGDPASDTLLLGLGSSDVVLTDFGVARIIKDTADHTAAGTILGSPAYMSPEQGRGERADRRSDIYSLGVVLYELLTGQVPFDADTPFAIVLKHTTAPLPPPRALRPDLPENLERLLLKALAKEPADRFQDAAAFGAAVREQTQGASVAFTLSAGALRAGTRPAASARAADPQRAPNSGAAATAAAGTPPQSTPSFETRVLAQTIAPTPAGPQSPAAAATPVVAAPRKRGRWLLGCLLTFGLVTLVGVGAFIAGGATVFQGLAGAGALVVPTTFSAEATALAATMIADGRTPPELGADPDATADELDEIAQILAEVRAACAGPPCAADSATAALAILDAAISDRPDNAALRAARSQIFTWWDPDSYREQAQADAEAAIAADPASAAAYLARGQLFAAIAQSDEERSAALADLDRAIELAPDMVEARLARAVFRSGASDFYDEGSPSREQVIADTSVVIAADPQNIQALNLRGNAYSNGSQPEAALADYQAVLALDPADSNALSQRGNLYRYYLDDPTAALADYAALIAVLPDDPGARQARATLAAEQGDYATALGDVELLLAVEPNNPEGLNFRGLLRLALEQPAEASADFAQALLISGDDPIARYGRGVTALVGGDAPGAIPDLAAAAEGYADLSFVWSTFHRSHPVVFVDLARAYLQTGQPGEALTTLDRAIEADGNWHLLYLLRGRLYREAGDRAAARADLRQALDLAQDDAERTEVEDELRLLQ